MVLTQLANISKSSGYVDQSQRSQPPSNLSDENTILKEQLELVRQSLAVQQEKAQKTELTMMDAIMQMKDQIQ